MKKNRHIAIIGAGLGGLAAAIRLAVLGYKVDVYERHSQPGGKACLLETGGFKFDTGPSLLTMAFVLDEIFSFAGEHISDHLQITRLSRICKYFFPDGTVLNAEANTRHFAEEIKAKTSDSANSVLNYLEYCRGIYDATAEFFLHQSIHEPSMYFHSGILNFLGSIGRLDAMRTMNRAIATFFKDPRTIQLFSRYATYTGSSPYQAPATYNIIPHVEYNMGSYVVSGGIWAITVALYELALKKGVNFFFNSPVDRIIINNRAVVGIIVNDEPEQYSTVVSNADVHYTYRNLLGDTESRPARRYARLEPSLSGVVFYWGVRGQYPELEINNIFFSSDYRKEFSDIFEKRICPDDPTIYVNITSRYTSGMAPEGCENWFVLVNAPYNANQDWSLELKRTRKRVFEKINHTLGTSLENRILVESSLTPPLIERNTNSKQGSIYGISGNSRAAAFLRQANRSHHYKGLYFCGGSAHPGGGMPLVLLSGKITSELIQKFDTAD